MKSLTYTVILERNEDCGYTVAVPALRGCVTQGNTIAEALIFKVTAQPDIEAARASRRVA
ncbi:MAG: type II toxin-antitoxin system HicB family antitoxin [Armatimonadetes bacterium]|nr:type II toxin-antitoxin system HicB family antitoxin [Armatimonadota bacterium]